MNGVVASPAPRRRYLTVSALERTFALPVEFTRSVFEIETLTRVPSAPAHIVGLTNARGAIIAVVCLASRLRPGTRALGIGDLAVTVELSAETFALAVEEVGEVTTADAENASPSPVSPGAPRLAFASGALLRRGELVPILDPSAILEFSDPSEPERLTSEHFIQTLARRPT